MIDDDPSNDDEFFAEATIHWAISLLVMIGTVALFIVTVAYSV